jgi:hypothetical protein
MANCIAECYGYNSSRTKDAHRLGSQGAKGKPSTWRTFATAYVGADGGGYVKVERDGKTLHEFSFDGESEKPAEVKDA